MAVTNITLPHDNDDELDDETYQEGMDECEALGAHVASVIGLDAFAAVETLYAAEMDLGEYLEMRDWTPDEDDDLDKQGYFVQAPKFGPGFMEQFSGFVFWVSKEQFEERYTKLPKYPH